MGIILIYDSTLGLLNASALGRVRDNNEEPVDMRVVHHLSGGMGLMFV